MTVPLYNLTDTWNNGATVFTALQMNVTNTASAAGSALFDYQVGGTSTITGYNVVPSGLTVTVVTGGIILSGTAPIFGWSNGGGFYRQSGLVKYTSSGLFSEIAFGGGITTQQNYSYGWTNANQADNAADTMLFRDGAAGIIAQRNSTNAQTFRVYNTFTNSSNYECGVFDWTTEANVLTIGTQSVGSVSNRNLKLFASSGTFHIGDGTTGVVWNFHGQTAGTNPQVAIACLTSSNQYVRMNSTTPLQWSSGTDTTFSIDTGISRSAAGVIALGNGTQGDGSATILAKTKAGAFAAGDIPAGTWILGRDTSGATTKLYYNNAGTLMVVALV